MTDKQMEKAKETVRHIPFKDRTNSQRKLSEELSCRDMINSCLCYGGIQSFYKKTKRWNCAKQKYAIESYADGYIEKLGEDRVSELVKEQEEDFAKAKIIRNYLTDDEGISYSAIVWADEQ